MKKMEQSTENKAIITLKQFKSIIERWKQEEKDNGIAHKLPVTAMLESFGLIVDKLTNGGNNVSFLIDDKKKYLLAKLKYSF